MRLILNEQAPKSGEPLEIAKVAHAAGLRDREVTEVRKMNVPQMFRAAENQLHGRFEGHWSAIASPPGFGKQERIGDPFQTSQPEL